MLCWNFASAIPTVERPDQAQAEFWCMELLHVKLIIKLRTEVWSRTRGWPRYIKFGMISEVYTTLKTLINPHLNPSEEVLSKDTSECIKARPKCLQVGARPGHWEPLYLF